MDLHCKLIHMIHMTFAKQYTGALVCWHCKLIHMIHMCIANQYVMASFASSLAAGVTVCLCCKLIYIIHMHFAKQYMMASFAFSFAAGAAVYLHCKLSHRCSCVLQSNSSWHPLNYHLQQQELQFACVANTSTSYRCILQVMASFASSLTAAGATVCLCFKLINHIIHACRL